MIQTRSCEHWNELSGSTEPRRSLSSLCRELIRTRRLYMDLFRYPSGWVTKADVLGDARMHWLFQHVHIMSVFFSLWDQFHTTCVHLSLTSHQLRRFSPKRDEISLRVVDFTCLLYWFLPAPRHVIFLSFELILYQQARQCSWCIYEIDWGFM
jgi:hypothetical protein